MNRKPTHTPGGAARRSRPDRPQTRPRGHQQIRIIGGHFRSRQLRFPDVEGLRPTGDRVRETLFNWLGQTLAGKSCLDLFAGSGALGFEALSRGARRVEAVDSHAAVVRQLRLNADLLDTRQLTGQHYLVQQAEALTFLSRASGPYDIVFLDPPFATDPWKALLARLPAVLAPGGLVYAEAAEPPPALHPPPPGWLMIRSGRAGAVWFALFRHSPAQDPPQPTEATDHDPSRLSGNL